MRKLVLGILLTALSALFGCATKAPTAEFKKAIADSARICASDTATVIVVASDGVTLNEESRKRLESRIKQKIDEKKSNAPCQGPQRDLVLNSKITQYEEGNKFARAMIAGLGQIHIDGDFTLTIASKQDETLAEFTLNKTFAWGGIYGASTGIEDVEPAFADGVASAIVVQTPENTEKK